MYQDLDRRLPDYTEVTLIDWIVFYAVLAISQPFNGGTEVKLKGTS